MGTGESDRARYGPVAYAEVVLHDFGPPILRRSFEYGVIAIAGVAFSKFAAAIFAGYAAYRVIMKVRSLKADYDEMEGPPEEKLAQLAVREGFKIIVSETIGMGLDKPTDQAIDRAIHTTADIMSSQSVFTEIVKQSRLPDEYSDDLRYFFTTTSRRTLRGSYAGAKDKITDYVARGIA